jgi:aerobic carbon-monoxide dehydrogenase medium subunit
VKPAQFDHVAPDTVEAAVAALASEPGARVLAGGQSLLPLMALRRVRPALLVDVTRLDLDRIERGGNGIIRLGALVRHRRLERDVVVRRTVPLLAKAARWIGHPAIRHRGTLGGSLSYADPAAELPAALVALGGSVVVHGPGGLRTVAAGDLFAGPYRTTLGAAELVVEVRVPSAGPRHGAAFCEWAPRHNDRAVAGVALAVERDAAGRCASVRAAACAVAGVPLDLSPALAPALGESAPTDALLRTVAESVRTLALTPPPVPADIAAAAGGEGWSGAETDPAPAVRWGDREDRAELAGLLAARALRLAFDRSTTPAVAA